MLESMNLVSGVLALLGYGPYIWSVLRNEECKPMRISWTLWLVIDVLMYKAQAKALGEAQLQVTGAAIGCFIVFVLAMYKGQGGYQKIDVLAGALGIIGIIGFILSGEGTFGVVAASAACICGGIPTVLSAWRNPKAESWLAWLIWLLSGVAAFLAMPEGKSWMQWLQPVAFALGPICICLIQAYDFFRPPKEDKC
jgi:hypothetical protein